MYLSQPILILFITLHLNLVVKSQEIDSKIRIYFHRTEFINNDVGEGKENTLDEIGHKSKHEIENKRTFFSRPVQNNDNIHFMDDAENSNSIGFPCKRSNDKADGVCLPAKNCLHSIRHFKMFRIKPDICAFDKMMPIICCSTKPVLFTKNNNTRKFHRNNGRISAKKCAEFSEIFTKNISYSPLIMNPTTLHLKVTNCVRGRTALIVGGEVSKPGEFPHMAELGWRVFSNKINWACGGSLISENFVITAAHCTYNNGKPPDIVRLGDQNLYKTDDGAQPQDIIIARIFIHPNYNTNSYYHDIALLKLVKPPTLTKFVRPACLWQDPELNFSQAIATGWGRIEFAGPESEELHKVSLNIIANQKCNEFYKNERKLPNGIIDLQFCAGYLEGGRDTCHGDSGGPIQVVLNDNKCIYYIIGLTSFGKFCAAADAPGVYTKIYPYLNWIENIAFDSIK